ncbi:uncharacterized protein LODBEIA_P42150 [Lodderomyces beijingensis]|uniref:DNA-directed DNA polymerase n=1 Tax=Lodderomyces beijingensis TaxID=1775926 RepID=A0ABP0ZSQ7_9ASCO
MSRRPCRYTSQLLQGLRWRRALTTSIQLQNAARQPSSLQFKEEPRINQVGIQYLSKQLHEKVFPGTKTDAYLTPRHRELLEISKRHLKENELLGKKTQLREPINVANFPDLVGKSLDEHFYKIGKNSSEPYLTMAQSFLSPDSQIPPIPAQETWIMQSGWTRYAPGEEPHQVPYPLEDELVFDVEVLYKIDKFACLATCASSKAWYGWVSPALIEVEEGRPKSKVDWHHLIPMNCAKQPKLIIGYNVSFDRARILEEYNVKMSKAFYLDGMALHVATSGLCSRQRPQWMKFDKSRRKGEEEDEEDEEDGDGGVSAGTGTSDGLSLEQFIEQDPWLLQGTMNSLSSVAKFHCDINMKKEDREFFASQDPSVVVENFNLLMNYCAHDVDATFKVTRKLFPDFFAKIPHPVSFAALRHLGALILPTTKKWLTYIESAEACYNKNRLEVTHTLEELAANLIKYIKEDKPELEPDHQEDPWLAQLDWTLKQPRLKKDGTPMKNNAYMCGYPEWYRDLYKTPGEPAGTVMSLTLKSRITPLLLRLKWEGYPLFWVDSQGWCFKVPFDEDIMESLKQKHYVRAILTEEEIDATYDALNQLGKSFVLFKVPHPDGPKSRCTSVLSKSYLKYFENGIMTSQYEYATKILKLNNTASYWTGNRRRIMDQFVVFNEKGKNKFFDTKKESEEHKQMGIILPSLVSMGTVTRRATENTWLTASNAKKDRIGSELKSLIEAPRGYCFVGADVDSEELWIASLVGDSMFEMHGGTAMGWMTLEGEKSEKTDLHSKTAAILGISRNDAKVFNYGRIYGAGLKFATRLLKQFNPRISDEDAAATAKKLYTSTKGMIQGSKLLEKKVYYGGTESIMFNALEAIAQQQEPRTPVLGAKITDALKVENLNKNTYMTSRVNWTIQSSGVDYLHLLIVSMEYLAAKYNIEARLAITVHDELRYLVNEKDKYVAALLLQISNLWTRAMFCEQLGIKELPQSCAFFSEVDVDHVLRKEVSMPCVTPSHPEPIPVGESLSIETLLEKTNGGDALKEYDPKPLTLRTTKYSVRDPIIHDLSKGLSAECRIALTRLQTALDKEDWRSSLRKYRSAKNFADSQLRKGFSMEVIDARMRNRDENSASVKEDELYHRKRISSKTQAMSAGIVSKRRNASGAFIAEYDLEEEHKKQMPNGVAGKPKYKKVPDKVAKKDSNGDVSSFAPRKATTSEAKPKKNVTFDKQSKTKKTSTSTSSRKNTRAEPAIATASASFSSFSPLKSNGSKPASGTSLAPSKRNQQGNTNFTLPFIPLLHAPPPPHPLPPHPPQMGNAAQAETSQFVVDSGLSHSRHTHKHTAEIDRGHLGRRRREEDQSLESIGSQVQDKISLSAADGYEPHVAKANEARKDEKLYHKPFRDRFNQSGKLLL